MDRCGILFLNDSNKGSEQRRTLHWKEYKYQTDVFSTSFDLKMRKYLALDKSYKPHVSIKRDVWRYALKVLEKNFFDF